MTLPLRRAQPPPLSRPPARPASSQRRSSSSTRRCQPTNRVSRPHDLAPPQRSHPGATHDPQPLRPDSSPPSPSRRTPGQQRDAPSSSLPRTPAHADDASISTPANISARLNKNRLSGEARREHRYGSATAPTSTRITWPQSARNYSPADLMLAAAPLAPPSNRLCRAGTRRGCSCCGAATR